MLNKILFRILTETIVGRCLSDKAYLSLLYRIRMGRRLDLRNPRTFTEKIQWLKLNWRYDIVTQCADKCRARSFVEDRIGPQVLKKLYGVYEEPEDIDIDKLPDAFVLKVNHGWRQNIFCRNKSELDWNKTARRLKKYLKEDHYRTFREWSYKNIVPCVLCEEHLTKDGETLYEYGFYCYDGVPRQIDINEYNEGLHRVTMFDCDLNPLENRYGSPPLPEPVRRTPQLEKMLEYAAILSKGFPFVRVDLIEVNNRIYFGEMTFYPVAGIFKLDPPWFDSYLGSFLHLPIERL
jgi:hypothetical protein